MSILDSLPHTYAAKTRTRVKDTLGGSTDSYATLSSGTCWHQQAGDSEVSEYQKREITISGKVYFTADPALHEGHVLVIDGQTYDVMSYPEQDASAGLGVVWRVMVLRKTTEE